MMTQAIARARTRAISSQRSEFLAGARDTFPLIIGAITFGLIFGALAGCSGLSFAGTAAMSVAVFDGSAQARSHDTLYLILYAAEALIREKGLSAV
jgi:hypothetical protein